MLSEALLRALTGRMSRRTALLLFAMGRLDALLLRVDPFDGNSVKEFVAAAAEIAVAAQQQAVTLVTATQRTYLSEVGIELADFIPEVADEVRGYNPERASEYVRPRSVRSGGVRVERLPIDEVFNRPIRDFRENVGKGMDESKALAIAADRAKMYLSTNVALAEREATHQILGEAERRTSGRSRGESILGYRRVIHPEASDSGVCGLCIAASDRIYRVENLQPLHNHCKCETMPVTRSSDPGRDLNGQDLDRLYSLAGGNAAKQLGKIHFKVDEHGELGPVLRPSRKEPVENFTYRDPSTDLTVEAIDLDTAPVPASA